MERSRGSAYGASSLVSTKLFTGQVVSVIRPDLRGMRMLS